MSSSKPFTALAFDYGTRHIGAAIGQSVTGSARELPPLRARDGVPDWLQVGKLLQEWQPDYVIVGLPLNMDATESDFSTRARRFGNRLHGRFGIPVRMHDERLSTREAKAEARELGMHGNYADNPVDSIAARLILESWLRIGPVSHDVR